MSTDHPFKNQGMSFVWLQQCL